MRRLIKGVSGAAGIAGGTPEVRITGTGWGGSGASRIFVAILTEISVHYLIFSQDAAFVH